MQLPSFATLLILAAPCLALVLRDTSSTQYTDDKAFQDTVLNITNSYRQQHNASALTWNDTLADTAKEWAEKCGFEHSGGPTGENLSSGYANVTSAVMAWGSERKEYDYKKAEFSTKTGHFTQLVWKSSTSVGCARQNCTGTKASNPAPGWFVVCEYFPQGNVQGQFSANVQKPIKGAVGEVPDESAATAAASSGLLKLMVLGTVVLMAVL